MVDASPAYLDPALGSAMPRPPGLRVGSYPQQSDATTLRFWTIGISDRGIRQPFGDVVGAPLHYEYDLCPSNVVAIDCRGDPANADDRSVVQPAQNNPPVVGRVFTTLFWFDWRHTTLAPAWNRNLATKSPNAYLGQQTRAGTDRPVLGVSALAANGGTATTALANLTLVTPGNATKAGLDAPLISEDGTSAAPVPMRVPCWIGRSGFRGQTGQVIAAGSTTQILGFFLKLKPLTLPFTENASALKIEFAAATAEHGCEAYGACAYTMALLEDPTTYFDPDFTKPAPYPCKVYGTRVWKTREQTAYVEIFLTPLGDVWNAALTVHQVTMTRSSVGGRYVVYSNFSPNFHTEKGALQQTKPADQISTSPISFGGTTTITRNLFTGEATLTITITVSATGTVTTCEARITRNVVVSNLGAGWHDTFKKL